MEMSNSKAKETYDKYKSQFLKQGKKETKWKDIFNFGGIKGQ